MKILTAIGEALLVLILFALFTAPFIVLNNLNVVPGNISLAMLTNSHK